MYLAYFDENKYSEENPYFFVGGILVSDSDALEIDRYLREMQEGFFGTSLLTKQQEFHGKEIFHGKGEFKGIELRKRIAIFKGLAQLIIKKDIPIRMVCIDVHKHREKYKHPNPEYQLGLMLFLERFCDYLEEAEDIGIVFGDYEKDEITSSVRNFSEFKRSGSTPMYGGRSLEQLLDTIYFTQSHHSRFLQVADILIYMAGRYENPTREIKKWHDRQINAIWQDIKASADIEIQRWP